MRTSQTGIDLLKFFEGCELKAYQDSVGVWTIGYGHTKDVKSGMEITLDEAEEMLKHEMSGEYEGYVQPNGAIIDVSLQQNQFDALVCWVYNLGPTNLRESTMLKRLNAGMWDDVPAQMERWDRAGGKKLLGLTRRRKAESLLFEGKDWTKYKEGEN